MKCTSCAGNGCDGCSGLGRIKITECPKKWIGTRTATFLMYSELYKTGLAPVKGGSLDQAHWFNEASHMASQKEVYWRNKQGFLNG